MSGKKQMENNMQDNLVTLGNQISAKRAELAIIVNELDRNVEMVKNLGKEADKHGEKLMNLKDEHRQIKSDLEIKTKHLAESREELSANKTINTELINQFNRQSDELAKFNLVATKLKAEINDFRDEKAILQTEVANLKQEKLKNSSDLENLVSKVIDSKAKLKKLEAEIESRKVSGEEEIKKSQENLVKALEDREGDCSFKENNMKEKEERLRSMIREAEKFYNRRFPPIISNL